MTWYLPSVFVHVMGSILWIGYVLFWLIVTGPLERRAGAAESSRILGLVNRAPWPPRNIPVPVRLAFSQVAWALLIVLAVSGVVMLGYRGVSGSGWVLAAKLTAVAVVVILHLRLARRPGRGVVYALSGAAVTLVVLSALLARTGAQ